jgi:nucleoside transporter
LNVPRPLYLQLIGMMFLEYFGLGAWIVSLARYLSAHPDSGGLGFDPRDVGLAYATLPVAGMLTPLLIAPLADRYFAAQKMLAVLQFLMAGLLVAIAFYCEKAGPGDPWVLAGLMQLYAFALMPTLTLTNVLALKNLPRPGEQFGRVRLFGTFGWIVAGFAVSGFLNPVSAQPFWLAAATALLTGLYALTLPHTPPQPGVKKSFGREAISLFRQPAFAAFAIATILGNMMNQFYVLFAARFLSERGIPRPEAVMTIGQWCEMLCMAIIPFAVRLLGLKAVMAAGLLGWVLRNATLAYGPDTLLVGLALPLHGFCYVYFSLVGTLVVDREAPPEGRASAQALVTFLGSGPAVLVGNFLAGRVAAAETVNGAIYWPYVWAVPLLGCCVAAALFLAIFPNSRKQ